MYLAYSSKGPESTEEGKADCRRRELVGHTPTVYRKHREKESRKEDCKPSKLIPNDLTSSREPIFPKAFISSPNSSTPEGQACKAVSLWGHRSLKLSVMAETDGQPDGIWTHSGDSSWARL